jgi:hypothetical protein
MEVHLETGPEPNRVRLGTGAETRLVELAASSRESLTIEMPPGLPYRPDPRFPTNYVYTISIASETGFIPLFRTGARDNRFLGIFVRLVPLYE